MKPVLLLWFAAAAAFASGNPFDGRWNIQPERDPKHRAWWLEVDGAKGRFVGFPGGNMNDISGLKVQDGELRFSFHNRGNDLEYSVRLENGKLAGTRAGTGGTVRFTGVRAPEIADKDDGTWVADRPVALFNGKDLKGWRAVVEGSPLGWTVSDGLMKNTAHANNLISDRKFWNFELDAEYLIGSGSNSGIGLRARYEIQILGDFGKPQNTHNHGALYSRVAPAVNATLPPDQWQHMHVRLVGRDLTVVLNGKTVLDKVHVDGLTAMATDPNEALPGPITIQGDHLEVAFRRIVVTPLIRKR